MEWERVTPECIWSDRHPHYIKSEASGGRGLCPSCFERPLWRGLEDALEKEAEFMA